MRSRLNKKRKAASALYHLNRFFFSTWRREMFKSLTVYTIKTFYCIFRSDTCVLYYSFPSIYTEITSNQYYLMQVKFDIEKYIITLSS